MSYFDVRLTDDPRRAPVWREVVRYLRPWLEGRKRVTEIGAGYCAFINAIHAPERTAVDIDPIVRTHAAPGIRCIVADVRTEALSRTSADAVLASNVFEHFTDDEFERVLGNIDQALTSGGILIAIQPNFRTAFRNYFDDYTHKKIFTDEGLCGALESRGWKIIRREARFLPFSFKSGPSLLPIGLLPLAVRAYLASPWRPCAGQMLIIAEKI